MFLTVLFHLRSLRWFAPTVGVLSTAPVYFVVWGSVRILTSILPAFMYRRIDDTLYSSYQRLILFFFEPYSGVKIKLYGDVDKFAAKKENVFYISNHQCEVDWVVVDMVAIRQGSLGIIRYLLKDGMRYLPLYGFYFKMRGYVFVGRSGRFEQSSTIKQLLSLQKNKIPMWMVVFPEGTRFNPELTNVIEKSQNFAKEEGFEVLNQVLTPRHKAVYLGLTNLRKSLDAFYDITIAYSNTRTKDGKRKPSPSMTDFVTGSTSQLHLHIKRYDIKDVPEDINGLRSWIHDRFIEKERLMSYFYSCKEKEESFPGEVVESKKSILSTLPSFLIWTGLTVGVLATKQGRSLYWKVSLSGIVFCWVYVRITK